MDQKMLNVQSLAEQFSPVHHFYLEDETGRLDHVIGFAAPLRGPRCCIVAIAAGDDIFAISRAAGFSQTAREKNLRLGWGGFSISGLAQAIAAGVDPELRCLVSGKTLKRWNGEELCKDYLPVSPKWSGLKDIRVRLQQELGCKDLEQAVEFALDYRKQHGPEALITASYRYILHRDPDPDGFNMFLQSFQDAASILKMWKSIMESPEAARRSNLVLAGPFEHGFPFSLAALDNPPDSSSRRAGAGAP